MFLYKTILKAFQPVIAHLMILCIWGILFSNCANHREYLNQLDKRYSQETVEQDLVMLTDSSYINSDEEYLIRVYLVNIESQGDELLLDITYRKILENAKAFQNKKEKEFSERKDLLEKKRKQKQESLEKIIKTINVTFSEIDIRKIDSKKFLTFEITFINKSEEEIKEIFGNIIFLDIFEEELIRVSVSYEEKLYPGSKNNKEIITECNIPIEQAITIHCIEMINCELKWEPEKLVLADGTILE